MTQKCVLCRRFVTCCLCSLWVQTNKHSKNMVYSSSREFDHFLSSECISCISRNSKCLYHVYSNLSLVPIVSRLNPIHPILSHPLSLRAVILISSTSSPHISAYVFQVVSLLHVTLTIIVRFCTFNT